MKVFGKKNFNKCCAVSLSMTLMLGCGAKTDSTEVISETVEASTETDELLEELSISLLADDVSEESVNKVKDSWKHLSEIVPLSDIEIAIGPSSRHEDGSGVSRSDVLWKWQEGKDRPKKRKGIARRGSSRIWGSPWQ